VKKIDKSKIRSWIAPEVAEKVEAAIEAIEARFQEYSMSSMDYLELVVLEMGLPRNLGLLQWIAIFGVAWQNDSEMLELLGTLEDVLTSSRFMVEK